MKKLITLFTIVLIAFVATAQDKPAPSTSPKQAEIKRVNDMMILRKGKMMIFKDSHLTAMDKPMTFKNGNVLTPTGLMTMKDGTTKQLAEGERLDMDGNMMANRPAPTPKKPAQSTPQNNQQK